MRLAASKESVTRLMAQAMKPARDDEEQRLRARHRASSDDERELFDGWRADLEHRLRAEEDHPVLLSHLAKYRSLLPSLALLFHLIDGVDTGRRGPVSRAAAAQ